MFSVQQMFILNGQLLPNKAWIRLREQEKQSKELALRAQPTYIKAFEPLIR